MATINFTTTDTTFTMEVNGINYGTWDKVQQVDDVYGITNGGNVIGITLQNPFKSYAIKLGDEVNINGEEITEALPVLAETIKDEVLYLPNSSGIVTVYQRKTTLTDAQIKALPTTIIDIVPAQGAGKIIVPIAACCLLNPSAGTYGNVVDASFSLCYNFDGDDSNAIMISSPVPAEAYLSATDVGLLRFLIPYAAPGQGVFSSAIVANIFLNQSYANKPIAIYDRFSESLSDYTGGHASNTLEVTVFYSIVDL